MLTLQHVELNRAQANFHLAKVCLSVVPGELLAVLGPNGAGKSTLIALLGGTLQASSGHVSLDGRSLSQWSPLVLARRRAVLSQHNPLAFRFKVRDVVAMGRLPYKGCAKQADVRSIGHAMELTDVLPLAARDYLTLSGGERQRVHLARVLTQLDVGNNMAVNKHSDPVRYLLLDEPTSALDLSHQHAVLQLARYLANEAGFGVLAVLHDPNLAALHADQVAIMANGQLQCLGTPGSILNESLFDSVFKLSVDVQSHPRHPDRPLVVAGQTTKEHSDIRTY